MRHSSKSAAQRGSEKPAPHLPAQTVRLALGPRSYDILVERGVLARLGQEAAPRIAGGEAQGRIAVVVTQPKVELYYGKAAYDSLTRAGFRVLPIVLAAGERYKRLQTVQRVYERLHAEAVDGRTVIVALGGGVIGDLAGFVAATYRRGLDFVQVPTTLLAQVDSSVGGKVGVNFGQGKNLIGAFHQPRLVLADPDTLHTLPLRERRSGLAEIIKYGAIYDRAFFHLLAREGEPLLRLRSDQLEYAIARSCEIKARVVEQDERDEGLRAILNFGHTIGHALEAATQYRIFRHGEAIALGMMAACFIGETLERTRPEDTTALVDLFRATGFTMRLDPAISTDEVLRLLAWDKKSVDGAARFVLMERLGHATPGHGVPTSVVQNALARLQKMPEKGEKP